MTPAPDMVWPEEPWIGVVRLRLEDITAVDVNGRLCVSPRAPSTTASATPSKAATPAASSACSLRSRYASSTFPASTTR